MTRFHIVVSNYNRISSFVEKFHSVHNFDFRCDGVIIMDCSSAAEWRNQLEIANHLTTFGLQWGESLYFIRRRNWGVNHGAQLDYFRLLRNHVLPIPSYTAFVQDHYFDTDLYVKEDSIPDDADYDLNRMDEKFRNNGSVGCIFFSRNGIRVCTSNPLSGKRNEFFGNGSVLLPGAVRRSFCVDGGNFIVRPELYLRWFDTHPGQLTRGNGTYGFSHVWEVRLGEILYRQRIKWVDMYRNLEYTTLQELDEIEKVRGQKASMLWYDNRVWFFFYGKDLQRYPPMPFLSVLGYLRTFVHSHFHHCKDLDLTPVRP